MSPTLAGGIFITAPPGKPKLLKNSINDQLDGLIYRILQTPFFFFNSTEASTRRKLPSLRGKIEEVCHFQYIQLKDKYFNLQITVFRHTHRKKKKQTFRTHLNKSMHSFKNLIKRRIIYSMFLAVVHLLLLFSFKLS